MDDNEQITQRRAKLAALRQNNQSYPNDFRRSIVAADIHSEYGDQENTQLEEQSAQVKVAGRMMTRRIMGKASFVHIQDMSGQIQLYINRDLLPEGDYNQKFKTWDIGDIIGAEGTVFKTKMGELSVKVHQIRLLTKSLRPLPEKFHGLVDQEMRYRQRYLDLIMNESTRRTFQIRSQTMNFLRQYLTQLSFIEVETPMMQTLPGGAAAKPFKTYHNALDMDLFLRIAPELYLKRLVVGGFEKVFEINRNFRNEGLSTRHNPEFTMLEFYQAYSDYNDLMNLTETMLRSLTEDVLGATKFTYQGDTLDFGKPFQRFSIKDAILKYNTDVTLDQLETLDCATHLANKLEIPVAKSAGLGKVLIEIFEKTVEHKLIEPTFITGYPTEVSPLARCNDVDAFITDRFEFFVGGREIANGFSELNDPDDQAERFRKQVAQKESGDDEAMSFDEDYITALEYGMPPTAGEGIGIDRLVMLLADAPSIRDVLLFPHMRPLNN